MKFINLFLDDEIEDIPPVSFCDLRVLARKLGSLFDHPTTLYASSIWVHLRLLAGPFGQGFKETPELFVL